MATNLIEMNGVTPGKGEDRVVGPVVELVLDDHKLPTDVGKSI